MDAPDRGRCGDRRRQFGAPCLKAKTIEDNYEFSVQPGVIGWLRACARRNAIPIEPAEQ
ncbi:hypothetical protein [Bradyrhizobium sp. USDA 4486]